MAMPPDEDEVDLGISLEVVATVVDHARAVQGLEEDAIEDLDDEEAEDLAAGEDADDLTEESLIAFIDALNADEQAALVALAWTGRGDYAAEEWEEALRLATERAETGDTGSYLVGMEMLGDLLAEGVAAFGLSIEDVER